MPKALCLSLFIAVVLFCKETSAGDKFLTRYEERNPPSASDFGGIGLLQTRTARFGREGQFDVGFSDIAPYRRYFLSLIALPGVEGTFRYSDIRNRQFIDIRQSIANAGQTLKDRGADLKVRVLDEGKWHPAIAIGVQDGVGTGLFNGEYVVASKRYKDFDFSLGLGWGNVGAAGDFNNPFTLLSNSFKLRESDAARGGQFSVGKYFSGEKVAMFGGIEYTTPLKGLTLKLEYEGNNYQSDPRNNVLPQSTRFNYGFNYRPFSWIDLAAAYERGEELMLRASLRYNFHDDGIPNFQDPPPPPLTPRRERVEGGNTHPNLVKAQLADPWQEKLSFLNEDLDDSANRNQGVNEFFSGLEAQGFEVASLELRREEVIINLAKGSASTSTGAALTAIRALPLPLQRVTFRHASGGVTDSITYERQDVVSESAIDGLFSAATKWDLEVTEIEISKRSAVVWVVGDKAEQERYLAARDFATSLKDYADTVQVIANGFAPDASEIMIRSEATAASGDEKLEPVSEKGAVDDIARKIFESAGDHGLQVEALQLSKTRATVYVSPTKYREAARGVGRAARLVANNVPPDVEEISVVYTAGGLHTGSVTLLRKDLENAVSFQGSTEEVWENATFQPRVSADEGVRITNPDRYPSFRLGVIPRTTQYIGDSGKFILYGVWAGIRAGVNIAPGLTVSGLFGYNLFDNFDKIRITSDSVITRVRTDIKKYLTQREAWVEQLQADYMFTPIEDVFVRFSAGIFEQAYAGYGGEFLYRPFNSRWAIGADLNWVRQRDFEQRLELLEYTTVTGHANVYYELPWYDLLAAVNAGRYLAKDIGATFALSRLFESGIRAGAFFTLTNLSAEDFGEGSFDKGFYLVVPFQLFLPTSSLSLAKFGFRPLTRDGGAALRIVPRLYDVTAGGNLQNLVKDWDRLLD